MYQVFRDIDYRSSEALVAQNEKVTNIEQRFGEAALQLALQTMGLTQVNQRFAALTAEIEQMAQSRKLPTVLVKSDIVGNHRYSVPEFSKWADIVASNEKSFAVDSSTNRIVSLATKAKKVDGLFLALGSVAVKPTDAVDAKKEYDLLEIGGEPEVTPVTPE